jgi:hypothetical protein
MLGRGVIVGSIVMLTSHRGLVKIQELILDFVRRKVRAGEAPIEGAVNLNRARGDLRPTLEMIDDDELRSLAVEALNSFAETAKGIAPEPGGVSPPRNS